MKFLQNLISFLKSLFEPYDGRVEGLVLQPEKPGNLLNKDQMFGGWKMVGDYGHVLRRAEVLPEGDSLYDFLLKKNRGAEEKAYSFTGLVGGVPIEIKLTDSWPIGPAGGAYEEPTVEIVLYGSLRIKNGRAFPFEFRSKELV